ncbi:MAG: hypothetical protein WBQ78_14855 [Gammaproteobacteria bacterium]
MAIIYDLSTGKVISEYEAITAAGKPRHEPEYAAGLQPLETACCPEDANPCDAYMVLLQRLLKDL